MGRKRLTHGVALSTLFVSLTASALELDLSQPSSLALVEQGCAYGRGALAIEAAKAQGLNNLRLFLEGETSFSFSTDESMLLDEQYDQDTREVLISGIAQGTVHADFGRPEIQGDDTCVTVRLTPPADDALSGGDDGIAWDSQPTISVVVTGEGKNQSGLTARQAAEQDAFRRAISQALGVMVKSGYLQQMYSSMSADTNNDDFNIEEVTRQSLSMQSQGMITSWNEIASQKQADGSLSLTLDVNVERQKMEDKVAQLIKSLGQPSVHVNARLPVVKSVFSETLAGMGFDLSSDEAQSTIILDVAEKAKVTSSGLQLEIIAVMRDSVGNQYATWRNDPTFMSLPNEPGMLDQLAAIHLATDQTKQAIKIQLQTAAEKMAMRGGPVRQLIFSTRAAGQQGQLFTLLSAINGVSDIKMATKSNKVVVQLRSLSNASELAQYIEPTLRVHQPKYRSKLSVMNEYQINVL
ncbi:hypothetical protein ACFFLZ_04625 [Photobacterium aphoticum]|uniref:Flagellar assembly protein T N-terminal domain-containing protein n=1 Tax=Photobacterium aphoticum TaxID=754436 RepID=A0A0J1GPN9_9GAMM|nr:hypothetical protein [Photobacterium aphoticum]KLV01713.1 hypothetical protein ABT58_04535 [Photobacterium aphoticum]PSU59292.1 hypothetical protein C9I90_04290 [Photobacterium aphoticum]GHA31713.1 hypothetical protein GCM10007086_01050 [Photobacterium aphoticum]